MNTSQWKLIATLLKNWILWALGKTWLLAPYFSEGTSTLNVSIIPFLF